MSVEAQVGVTPEMEASVKAHQSDLLSLMAEAEAESPSTPSADAKAEEVLSPDAFLREIGEFCDKVIAENKARLPTR